MWGPFSPSTQEFQESKVDDREEGNSVKVCVMGESIIWSVFRVSGSGFHLSLAMMFKFDTVLEFSASSCLAIKRSRKTLAVTASIVTGPVL